MIVTSGSDISSLIGSGSEVLGGGGGGEDMDKLAAVRIQVVYNSIQIPYRFHLREYRPNITMVIFGNHCHHIRYPSKDLPSTNQLRGSIRLLRRPVVGCLPGPFRQL